MRTQGFIVAAAVALVTGAPAMADHDLRYRGDSDIVYGRVISAAPIVRYVEVARPRRECWEDVEYRRAFEPRVAGTTLAGGIVGAAIGRQFGGGRGRDALTLVGGLAGALAGHEHATRRLEERGGLATYAVPVERCATVHERFTEEVIDGYDVVYQYQGRRYSMRTAEHPGQRVALRVSVRPVRY